MSDDRLSVFPISATVDDRGHLHIGGCSAVDLAHSFGTPLYVFDEATIRAQCRAHSDAFRTRYLDVRVLYAGKAYLGTRLARIVRDAGLGLDVVSGGELHVAKAAGFPLDRICFHGNNKSRDELMMALDWGVGLIAVDNLDELAALAALAAMKGVRAHILLRLAPAVDPHTHRYMATGVADSKFGLPVAGAIAAQAVERALMSPSLSLRGYHIHIGSQIHDLDAYVRTIDLLTTFAADMREQHGYTPAEISLGGGWAVDYLPGDGAPSPDQVAAVLSETLTSKCLERRLPLPCLSVEPGRAIVARAGVALYTIGAAKSIPGVRRYVFVDGGMADNIRPALYGARYTALVANNVKGAATELVTIAGRYCESGDVLISDILLPPVQTEDVLAVPVCGAYAPAMASNYNMALRPAIVGVADGRASVWRRRETLDDLFV
jgi:diaminopimelate decarboxylase